MNSKLRVTVTHNLNSTMIWVLSVHFCASKREKEKCQPPIQYIHITVGAITASELYALCVHFMYPHT